MNQKKLHLTFSKHRNKGFLLDFLVKALEIHQKDGSYSKLYQNFISQELSVQEYHDTLHTVIDDIVYTLYPDNKVKREFTYNYINEIMKLYDIYVSTHATLAASQKQLDFITLTTFVIPMISIPLDENIFRIITFIIPSENTTAIQKLLRLLEKDLNIKEILFQFLDSKKDTNYNNINNIINNWINGNNIPDNRHVEMIIEALKDKTHFSKDELHFSFYIAKIMQYLYKKSVNYFGEALTQILMFHYRYQAYFTRKFISMNRNKEEFDVYLLEEFKGKSEQTIFKYFDAYFYTNFSLKYYSIRNSLEPNYYDKNYKPKEILKDNFDFYLDFFAIYEERFFETLHSHLPFEYFNDSMKLESKHFVKQDDINEKYNLFLRKLNIFINPNQPTNSNSSADFENLREHLSSKYNLSDNPYSYFLNARYYAHHREYKKATEDYLQALKFGKNCIGEYIEPIISEGLSVSAKLIKEFKVDLKNSKSPFIKFYKEASFQNIISALPEDISETFLNDMKKQFDIYFRNLPDHEQGNMYITPNLFATSNQKNVRIDYNKPNKLIYKNLPNPISQLMYSCSKCDFDAVKKLIDNGADVNMLKQSDKASAAMFAIPGNSFLLVSSPKQFIENGKKIVNYLIPKMSKEALNTKLIKKQETLLSYCIEYGWVESIGLLIQNGVDLEQKVTLDKQSALYQVIQCIQRSKTGELFPSNSKFTIHNPLQSKDERKKLIKANPFLQGITDEERDMQFDKLSENFYKNYNDFEQTTIKVYVDNKENYIKIFQMILNASTKVDIPHKGNFTPLILATQINDDYIVKELLKKGANPDFYNDAHYRAYDYAFANNNMLLAELLE